MLSANTREKIEALISKYPRARSALIPSLQMAQREAGCLLPETMREIAEIFGLHPNEVYEVASFYTMLYRKPVGKYVIQICTNISCLLREAESLLDHLEQKLRISPGETTPDNKFTLLEVECLGSCGTAPVVQINDDYYENLSREKLDKILDSLE